MTREDAFEIWLPIIKMGVKSMPECSEALDMAIKALKQEPILDKIRAEIIKYEDDCRLSVDEYPSCKQCTDNTFETIYAILDKYKAESEDKK